MRRRGFLLSLLPLTLADGCTRPTSETTTLSKGPAPGALTAEAAYPPVGARWNLRVTETGLFHSTVVDQAITATAVDFKGRRAYGLAGPPTMVVLDPVSFNPIGTIEGGNVAVTDTPNAGLFSWPLWVGKSWDVEYSHYDRPYGAAWGPALAQAHISAIEDVTVPAGTFKAFRIEYLGGVGSSTRVGVRGEGGPGFETRDIYWYAPGPKLIVKSDVTRLGTNYRGGARTITELLSTPA